MSKVLSPYALQSILPISADERMEVGTHHFTRFLGPKYNMNAYVRTRSRGEAGACVESWVEQ